MAFFENQIKARRKTVLLVVLFFLAVGCIVIALNAAILGALAITGHLSDTVKVKTVAPMPQTHPPRSPDELGPNFPAPQAIEYYQTQTTIKWWQPELIFGISALTILIIVVASLWKTIDLGDGGPAVAQMLGATPIRADTQNTSQRKILNIVEEMSIASGVTMPKVYLLQDSSINAMAAGLTTSNAAIIVTNGAIKRLTRDELQGVIAHEFSHILNSDMRLNVRLIGILFGILVIAKIGYGTFHVLGKTRVRSKGGKGNGGVILLLIVLIATAMVVIGYIGLFFGKLIQSAVSRQREYLADASSVQFTRNPGGIVGALKKIGSLSMGSCLDVKSSMEMAHMFFGDPVYRMFGNIFSTHPPLIKRIRAIEPTFNGKFNAIAEELREEINYEYDYGPNNYFASRQGQTGVPAGQIAGLSATVSPKQMQYAVAVISELPLEMKKIVRSENGATAIVLGMLLAGDQQMRKTQLGMIQNALGQDIADVVECNYDAIAAISPNDRIPLLTLSLAALEHMDIPKKKNLRHLAKQIIESDNQVEIFEYLFYKIMWHRLRSEDQVLDKTRIRHIVLSPLVQDATAILSAIAYTSEKSPQAAATAMQNGIRALQHAVSIAPTAAPDLAKLDRAMEKWMHAGPRLKAKFMNAAIATAAEDGIVDLEEAELLRTLAILMECPLPPMLN